MRQLTVLLVEDNPRDVRLTQRAFKQAGLPHDLRVVRDGDEALAYLHREGAYKEAETAHARMSSCSISISHAWGDMSYSGR